MHGCAAASCCFLADICGSLLFVAAPGVALAQGEEVYAAMVGRYTALPADGRDGCPLGLRIDRTIGGRVAEPGTECAARVPLLADAAAWYPDGGVTLIDATRRVLMRFDEAEGFVWSSPTVTEPKFFLVPTRAGVTHVPRFEEVLGEWRLAQGAAAGCAMTVAAGDTAARRKPDDWHPLHLAAGCTPPGVARKAARWRIENTAVLVEAGEDVLAFTQTGATTFGSDHGGYRLSRPAR